MLYSSFLQRARGLHQVVMLLEISIFTFTIVLLALPSSNTYSRLKRLFSVIILMRLVPLNSSVFSLTPLVATGSVILWITSIIKRVIPYNYSHAYYVPTKVPYPLIPVSDLVRPVALTVRIVVNLSLTHLFIHRFARALIGVLILFILVIWTFIKPMFHYLNAIF